MSTHRPYHCLAYLILVIFVAACQSVPMGATLPKPAATSIATLPVSPTPTLVPIPTLPNPPDPRVAPPNQTNREGYLVRRVPGIPDVKIVDKDQSKLEFANTLEIEQLDSLAFVSIKAKREAK